ncbi:hypothetical protein EHV15_05245 [Paenibacillus oralis]|uniref:Uncharacterized protein n=1 Tax=Paenibacillus oralis TaxID=2490856 RepID=A0A3P3TWB3_9BACL|nr:hypothetical protein [Paenibacillus oralis]RRJ62421.1 hypothetical protein EHV15_05245 [Paenibacillus oralis]
MKLYKKILDMNQSGFIAKSLADLDLHTESESGFWTVGIVGENLIYQDEETAEHHRTEFLVAMVPGTPEECRDQMIALELFASSTD